MFPPSLRSIIVTRNCSSPIVILNLIAILMYNFGEWYINGGKLQEPRLKPYRSIAKAANACCMSPYIARFS